MDDFIKFQRKILLAIASVDLIAAVILYLLMPERWFFATGVILGGIGGLVVYRLKVLSVYKFAQSPESATVKSGFYGMAVMVGVIVVCILVNKLSGIEIFSKWTVLAGLIVPNIVLVLYSFFCPQKPIINNEEDSGEA